MAEFEFPTETIDLPSKGWFYPEENPLSSGQIDLRYMTAKHENILTSRNLMLKGTAIDKLLEALIASEGVKFDDLLIGDKNAVFVAARILGYGKNYDVNITCPDCKTEVETTVNLEELKWKEIDQTKYPKGVNEFEFELPFSKNVVTFKLTTARDEKMVNKELDRLKKVINDGIDPQVTTRMRHAILAVDGERDRSIISKFVDNIPSRDAKVFREYARELMPDVDFEFNFVCSSCGYEEGTEVPVDHTFFWPKS
ncbi:MAG: hypothetical protein KY428_08960 [Bacteroidetes bacterium]|nr:hypothetical protein [Bacteroidota bacterium]